MAGQRNQGKDGGMREDPTVMFDTRDPKIERVNLFSAQERLTPLRERLSGCTVLDNQAGVIFENFLKNLRGVAPLSIMGHKLLLVRTRSTVFLLSDTPHETLYETTPALMGVDLRRRCMLETGNRKHLYLINISADECAAIMRIAASDEAASKRGDTMAPGESTAVDMDDFKSKLAASSSDTGLDLVGFSELVKFAYVFKDENDRPYYFLVAGSDENSFRLYVNEPVHQEGAVYFNYRSERCILIRES
jgi:hypothetical protein